MTTIAANPQAALATVPQWQGYERVQKPIDLIFASYMALLCALALGAWLSGAAGPAAFVVFAAFYAANAIFSLVSRGGANRVRVGLARAAAGTLLAPAAYLLAGDPFMRWWPAFLLMCVGGTVLLSLHSGSARFARPLAAYYLGLYALAERLAPPPHDWYMVAMNAGAIAVVALLFGEVMAFLAATLASEREQRAQLAAEKARSETMLQQEAAQALRASEAHYRALLENAFDISTIVDRAGNFLYVSANFERELGHSPAELVGKPFMPLVHPEDLERLKRDLQSAFANPGQVVSAEVRARHRDGSWRWFEYLGKAKPDGTLVACSRDITERKQAEEALHRLNAELEQRVQERTAALERSLCESKRLAAIIEATSDYVGIADLEGRSVYVNGSGLRMVGKSRERMQGADVARCYPARELPKVGEMVAAALQGKIWSGELTLLHADGREIPVSEVTFAVPGADGRPQYLATIIRDISERERAEARIRASEERFRSLTELSSDWYWEQDEQFRFTSFDGGGLAATGVDHRSLIGKTRWDASYGGVGEAEWDAHKALLAEHRQFRDFVMQRVDQDGRTRYLSISGAPVFDAAGRFRGYRGIGREITARKRVEKKLERQLALFQALIDTMPASVAYKDRELRFLGCNRAHQEFFGPGPEDLAGRTVADLNYLAPEVKAQLIADDLEVLRTGQTIHRQYELRDRHGVLRPALHWKAPITMRDGKRIGLLGVVVDISEQKRAEAELKRAKDAAETALAEQRRLTGVLEASERELRRAKNAAEAANRAKSAFLATMSHEIRTPMNAVIGMTSLLLETPLSPRQRDFVETVRMSGDALLTVINDILDFSKIEADKLELAPRPFALRPTIEAVLDLLALRASEKGLEVACVLDESVPAGIVGDETRLRQILVNLVGNAIKFTAKGEVVVSVEARTLGAAAQGGARRCELQFSVCDTGPGIAADKMPRLFQSFSQLDSSATREHGGTGLGLAISRRLAELMGGRMWVESDGVAGRGATFRFTIVAGVAEVEANPRLRGGALPELRGRRILIVDDNATNRRILSLQARAWGMEAVEAASAAEALARVRSDEAFDLAVLDMHMPSPEGMPGVPADGVALAQEICALRGERRLPLVMLTSVGTATRSEAEAIHCFEAWLTKPVKPSQLYDALVKALAPGGPAAEPAADAAPSAAAPFADRLPFRILLAEDVVLNQKFALLALEQLGYRADVAANGLEALAALERQPYDVVLMDVQMPELDGLEATRHIRSGMLQAGQPYIIAMTANAMQGDREACLQAGMDDYVSKPVYLAELRAALERAAGGRASSSALRQESLASLLERKGGSELVALFAEEVARYASGFRQALHAGDPRTLARLAHDLKGSSGYFGAERLAELCRRLEQMGRAAALEGAAPLLAETEREIVRVRQALIPSDQPEKEPA